MPMAPMAAATRNASWKAASAPERVAGSPRTAPYWANRLLRTLASSAMPKLAATCEREFAAAVARPVFSGAMRA